MSVCSNDETLFIRTVLSQIRRITVSHAKTEMSHSAIDTFHVALALWICVFCDQLSLSPIPRRDFRRSAKRVIADMGDHVEVTSIFEDLNTIESLLLQCIGARDSSKEDFKRLLSSQSCSNSWIKGMVSDTISSFSSEVIVWRCVFQLCRYLKHLSMRGMDILEDEEIARYVSNLNRVSAHNGVTQEEQPIVSDWLKCMEQPTIAQCAFGPGATADKGVRSLGQKYGQLLDTARSRQVAILLGIQPSDDIVVRRPVSRQILVPKSTTRLRPIAAEDPMLMFYQQGLFSAFDDVFRKTKLRRRINLQDQSRSRQLALVGSTLPDRYSTIDLSSASDSVRYDLVKTWFADTPVTSALLRCRSTHLQYKDGELPLPLFASMGSALCFPIQCIVFAAQCEATIVSCGDDPVHSNYCVYGDDIIIETRYAETLIKRLESNGFLVNREKSYYSPNAYFREACGGFYWRGYDLTPLQISRRFIWERKRDPRMMSTLIQMANTCFTRSFFLTRKLIFLLSNEMGFLIPFSDDIRLITDPVERRQPWVDDVVSGSVFFSPSATNYHLQRRWNKRLQRVEFKYDTVVACSTEGNQMDAERLLYVLHKPEVEDSVETRSAVARTVVHEEPVLRRTWRSIV